MKNASTFFVQGTRRPGRSRRSGHGSRCPCFTDAGHPRPAVVVKIQCSLIQRSPSEEPAARSVRASIAFVSPQRPCKHGVCYDTARRLPGLCPGTLCPTGSRTRGPQRAAGAASNQTPANTHPGTQEPIAGQCGGLAGHPMPRRQQQTKTEGTSSKPPAGTAAARWAGCSHMYTYTDRLRSWPPGVRISQKNNFRMFANCT